MHFIEADTEKRQTSLWTWKVQLLFSVESQYTNDSSQYCSYKNTTSRED
jgi:hypothetical protein